MRKQTFYDWLAREVTSSRMALVRLYENRDRLLYVEAPQLRKKYMDVIGVYEEPVLQAELEVSLLRRKVELIQIAINRREPVDLIAIDTQLEKEKQEKEEERRKEKQIQKAILNVQKKYGKNALIKGMNLQEGATTMERNRQIGGHKA